MPRMPPPSRLSTRKGFSIGAAAAVVWSTYLLTLRRVRIVAVAVALADLAVLGVDAQLGPLFPSDLAAAVARLALRVEMGRYARGPAPPHVPATARVRDDVVSFRTFPRRHPELPCASSANRSTATLNSEVGAAMRRVKYLE